MDKVILEQLNMLKETLDFQVDGKSSKDFPKSFSNILFLKKNSVNADKELTFKFADYVFTDFMNDFNKKFNKGKKPSNKIMYGVIIKETEKMYNIKVRNKENTKTFEGWIPKKSVEIL